MCGEYVVEIKMVEIVEVIIMRGLTTLTSNYNPCLGCALDRRKDAVMQPQVT